MHVEVWMCPDCRMVAATMGKPNENPMDFVARGRATHGEHSPDCKIDAIRFRSVVVSALTGDRVLWGPLAQNR